MRRLVFIFYVALITYALASEGRAAENNRPELFKKNVGGWTIYATPTKVCVMSVTMLSEEGKAKRIIRFSISLGENYETIQIDIEGGNAPVSSDAIQKPVVMKIGKFSEEWKGVIAQHTPEKAIFVFLFDITILNHLSYDGVIQLKSKYSEFSFPFTALKDQIDALVDCSKHIQN